MHEGCEEWVILEAVILKKREQLLFVALCKYELTSKQASFALRALKRRLAGDDDWVPVRRSAAPQL